MGAVLISSEHDVYGRLIVRWDAWAKQELTPDEKGKYNYKYKKFLLTRKIIDESLLSNQTTIGVMTVLPVENTVINPTIDIDNHDGITDILNDVKVVYNALKAAGMSPYIEASAGLLKDGVHIGVICKPTAAATVKRAIEKILKSTGLKHEVNPKQESVEADGYGNLVKLPWQYNNRTKARSQIINPETLEPMDRHDAIKYMLALPETVFNEVEIEEREQYKEEVKEVLPKVETVTKEGVKELLSNGKIKHCIVKAHKEIWKLHGIGQEGHDFRYAAATELISWDARDEDLQEYFSVQADYNRETVRKQIEQIKRKKYTPTGCAKILEKCPSLVGSVCPTCNYYLKPKKNGEKKEKKPKEIKADIGEALAAGMGVYRGNMELAEEFQKVSPIYYDTSKNLWLWIAKEGFYKQIDETDILSAIRQRTNEDVIEGKTASEIIRGIQITGRERNVEECPETWIHTKSGIIDYTTQNKIPANPKYFLTQPIPHKIGISEDTPVMDALFKAWVPDRVLTLYEILAYSLINVYPIHRLFLLFGSGRNGKSQFLELLTRFIGRENTTSTELEKVIESRFEAAKLYRKKAALVGETNFAAIKSTDRIKKLTGGDMLTGEFKHKDPFDFYNSAKILISTNSVPETLDKTEGFYSRCIIIEFKNRFDEGKPIIDTIPDVEYDNLLLKCLNLLPGLLKKGKFTGEGTIEEKAENYERISNPFPTFKAKELKEDVNAELPIWIVRDMFEIFCTKNGFRKVSEKEFTQILKKEGYEIKRTWWGKNYWNTLYGFNSNPPYVYVEETRDKTAENKPDKPDKPRVPINSHIGEKVELPGLSGSCGSNEEKAVTDLKPKLVNLVLSKINEDYRGRVSEITVEGWNWYRDDLKAKHPITKDFAEQIINIARQQARA